MRCLAACLLVCLSATAYPQEPPPKVVLDAAHCLVTAKDDWLGMTQRKPTQLEFGFVEDTKSHHGSELLYLVNYITPYHSEGNVFAFLEHGKGSHADLRLEYKIGFRQTIDGSARVQLVDPPLGGIGTQGAALSAIRQIGFRTFTVPVTDLLSRKDSVPCDADAGIQ